MFKKIVIILMLGITFTASAQTMPIDYQFGEKFNDRHRYSNLLTLDKDQNGDYILIRAYFQGLVLRPKGYLIERYDKNLNLIEEYNYKLRDMEFVNGFVADGRLHLLFFNYNTKKGAYEYWVHHSKTTEFEFSKTRILSIPSKAVKGAYGKNYYNRNFSNSFTTTLFFDKAKNGFLISTHLTSGKISKHMLHLFDTNFNLNWEYDFSQEAEDKNYAFEHLILSEDLSNAYLLGKAYFKKKRFKAEERKFQYEMVMVDSTRAITQNFTTPGKYPDALYPIKIGSKLKCVGFYADRKDNRYNGLSYYELNPNDLSIEKEKYNPFSYEFMFDKFGREGDEVVKNLVFKSVDITDENEILFNAEEYFVTSSIQRTGTGQRIKVDRFHHNDIVSVKLDAEGNMVWARNINKLEVTQGDDAYASYSAYTNKGITYFFICTATEQPQQVSEERLIFRQGLGRSRNIFMIALDQNGKMTYEKIIDSKEARLPFMVSKPLIDDLEDQLLFYAKRGTKKQLVQIGLN